jgi:hypothetical protein
MVTTMRTLLLVAGLGLVGCAHSPTPYGPLGDDGGFRDFPIAPGRFHIEVRGNSRTSEFTLEQYFHRRADELCRGAGFQSHQGDPSHEATAFRNSSYSVNGHIAVGGSRPSKYLVSGDVTCT